MLPPDSIAAPAMPAYAGALVNVTAEPEIMPGEPLHLSLTVQNTGSHFWGDRSLWGGTALYVTIHLPDGSLKREFNNDTVSPGERKTFTFTFVTNEFLQTLGRYNLTVSSWLLWEECEVVCYGFFECVRLNCQNGSVGVMGPQEVPFTVGDIVPPEVDIAYPRLGARVLEPQIVALGSARDRHIVTQVDYRLGTNLFQAVSAWTPATASAWSAPLQLVPGTNVLEVRAIDEFNNTRTAQTAFVYDARPAVRGAYSGLFYPSTGVELESSGFLTANVAASGKFSAQLRQAGKRYRWTGQFDLLGHATKQIIRPGTNLLTVELNLDLTGGSGQLRGTVSDGNWVTELLADRSRFSTQPALMPEEYYTWVLPGDSERAEFPGGDSFGTVKLDRRGNARFVGTLAEGNKFAQSAATSAAGACPLYVSLEAGRSALLGWLTFSNRPAGDLQGPLSWIKPVQPAARFYGQGFTNVVLLEGSSYDRKGTNSLLVWPAAEMALSGSDLSEAIIRSAAVLASGHSVKLSTTGLTLRVDLATGLFTGRAARPDGLEMVTLRGAWLDRQQMGRGFFFGAHQSGRVQVTGKNWPGPPAD